jgi:cytochrome c
MPSGIEINKFLGAILLAGIIAMVSGLVAEGLYKGSLSEKEYKRESRGHTISGAEAAIPLASAQPAIMGLVQHDEKPADIMPLLAKADMKAGESLSRKCVSCHSFEKDGRNLVGPNQWGVVGSHVAHKDNYNYSPAVAAIKGKKWGFQELSDFLANPKSIPGNKMAFPGIPNPQDRANLIVYLNSQSDHPLSLPK